MTDARVEGPTTGLNVEHLRDQVRGRVITADDEDYGQARAVHNGMFDKRPLALLRAEQVADVIAGVNFARDNGLDLSIRDGGHSAPGFGTNNNGLVIDMTPMRTVRVDPGNKTAHAGAGATWGDFNHATHAFGLATTGGIISTTGVTGLTLGGGIGYLARACGLSIDNLISADVVTADGRFVTASEHENEDLFWGLRGGGGNFGVVTSFTFTTHPAGAICLFFLSWPWSQAARVIAGWQSWAPHAPDQLWSNLHLAAAPGGSVPSIQVGGTYLGSVSGAAAQLEKLYAAVGSHPSSPFLESTTWLHAMLVEAGCASLTVNECHLPTQTSGGRLSRASEYAKSDFFTKPLSSHGIGTLLAGVENFQKVAGAPGASGGIALDALGGAINRVAPGATAFVHRDALFDAQYTTTWPVGSASAEVARQHAWQQSFWQSMRPYASGQAYQNYIDPSLANWRQAYYGANYTRLTQVKAAYDPHRLFNFPQAV